MMTDITLRHIALTALLTGMAVNAQDTATINISNHSGQTIYFQPESALDYSPVECPDTTITISEGEVYYRLIDHNGNFHQIFVTPGSHSLIKVENDHVDISGSNEKENVFMNMNTFTCRAPKPIKTYSPEWANYNEREIARIDSMLDSSKLSRQFVDTHKLYCRYIFLNQRLNGIELAKAFNPGGAKIEISESYYDFLDSLRFDTPTILQIPKWFDVVNKALETKEKRRLLPVSNDNYMSVYAKAIDDETVRSHYLVNLLALTLKRNYLNDFSRQFESVKPLITDSSAVAMLPMLEKKYQDNLASSAKVATGTPMPEFTCKDVNGKEYDFSDFKGNYVILDFWFTGCAPCRAEMPYFDDVASRFAGKDVKFISLSVDTGEELYAAWEKMMKEKPHSPNVLSVNLPGGFNSPLLGKLNIRGVPRIMLIDREGKIIDSYAKRPSDPKLSQQIDTLLKKL